MKRTITGVLAACMACTLFFAPAATAATLSVADPRGDNHHPNYAITRVRYSNQAEKFVSTVWMTRLPRRTYADFWIAPRNHLFTYGVVVKRRDGKVRSQLWLFAIEGPGTKINCDLTVNWSRADKRIRASVPRSCIDLKGAMKMTTYIHRQGLDYWSDRSATRTVRRG